MQLCKGHWTLCHPRSPSEQQGPALIMAVDVEADARPESVSARVVTVDHGIDAEHAKRDGAGSGLRDQPRRDPGSPYARVDGESVQVTTPPVPSDDQRSDDLTLVVSHDERVGITRQQRARLRNLTGSPRRSRSTIPEVDHRREVVGSGRANRDHTSIMARAAEVAMPIFDCAISGPRRGVRYQ